MFLMKILWPRSLYLEANLCGFFLLGPAPFFVASLFWCTANAYLAGGFAGRFWFCWFFCCFLFGSKLICLSTDQICPCTNQLFTAYAIVRTEPSATSAIPRKKKCGAFVSTGWFCFSDSTLVISRILRQSLGLGEWPFQCCI